MVVCVHCGQRVHLPLLRGANTGARLQRITYRARDNLENAESAVNCSLGTTPLYLTGEPERGPSRDFLLAWAWDC
eukprot:9402936-Lingulodinium_polyedra.AAC.1